MLIREEKITPELANDMRMWRHSGFSVDQSVFVPKGDNIGMQRIIEYMARCPFSLSRVIKLTDEGKVLYRTGKSSALAFPILGNDKLAAGIKRNFEVFEPLDFLAEVTQHIPNRGEHQLRYYGWYSNKMRGQRAKREVVEKSQEEIIVRKNAPTLSPFGELRQGRLGHAHQMHIRGGSVEMPGLWRKNEDYFFHRKGTEGSYRKNSPSLWIMDRKAAAWAAEP